MLKNIFIKNLNLEKNIELTRIEISYHSGTKFYQHGKIQLNFKQYIYDDNKLKLVKSYGNSGSIWINKKISSKKFNFKNKRKF